MNITNRWQKQIYHMQRGNLRLLDTDFKMKSIKERAKNYFLTSQMHTSN